MAASCHLQQLLQLYCLSSCRRTGNHGVSFLHTRMAGGGMRMARFILNNVGGVLDEGTATFALLYTIVIRFEHVHPRRSTGSPHRALFAPFRAVVRHGYFSLSTPDVLSHRTRLFYAGFGCTWKGPRRHACGAYTCRWYIVFFGAVHDWWLLKAAFCLLCGGADLALEGGGSCLFYRAAGGDVTAALILRKCCNGHRTRRARAIRRRPYADARHAALDDERRYSTSTSCSTRVLRS